MSKDDSWPWWNNEIDWPDIMKEANESRQREAERNKQIRDEWNAKVARGEDKFLDQLTKEEMEQYEEKIKAFLFDGNSRGYKLYAMAEFMHRHGMMPPVGEILKKAEELSKEYRDYFRPELPAVGDTSGYIILDGPHGVSPFHLSRKANQPGLSDKWWQKYTILSKDEQDD